MQHRPVLSQETVSRRISGQLIGGIATLLLFLAGAPDDARAASLALNCSTGSGSISDDVTSGNTSDTLAVSGLLTGDTVTFTSTHINGGSTEITVSASSSTVEGSFTFTVKNSTPTNVSVFNISANATVNFTHGISGSTGGSREVDWTAVCSRGTDTTPPVISSTPADIVQSTDPGLATATVTWTPPTASDNVGVTSFTSTHNPGDTFPLGVTTVTYTAMDAAGNTTTSSFTVTIYDAEAPVISGTPANIAQGTDAGLATATVTWTAPAAADNVAVTSFTSTHNPGDTFPIGVTTVTYTALDAAGNTAMSSFTVTISDTEDPVISGTPADITQNTDAGLATAIVTWTPPTSADNVAVTSFTSTHNPGDTFPTGVTTVTYTAIDAAGNTATSSFTVTISDTEDPVISGTPADIAQNTDAGLATAVVTWTPPTAADNVAVTSFTSTHNSGDAFPIGVTTVTYTAMDAAGNTATASFKVTISDAEDPVISGTPADIVQSTDLGLATATVTWTPPTAADNVGVTSFTSTHAPGDAFPTGVMTVIYTATDAAGNTMTASFTVTIFDVEAPVISGTPANIVQGTDAGVNTATVTWTPPTAADNVAVTSFTSTHNPGDTFPIGVTTVTYSAMDAAGNTATSSFTVAISDTEDPVISGTPADIVQGTDAGLTTAVVTWTPPTAADNVGVTSVTSTPSPGNTFPIGVTTVTYTAMDAAGNTAMSSFTVTISDTEDPMIFGTPANIAQNTDAGLATATVTWTPPTAADNVGVTSFTSTHNPGDAFPIGLTTVTYSAMDAAGNTATSSFTVTISDIEAPVVAAPADVSVGTDTGLATAAVTFTPTATDNSGVAPTITPSPASGSAFPIGTTLVTVTATDGSGNVGTATFNVTVTDDEAPTLTLSPGNLTSNTDAGVSTAVVSYSDSTFTDNVAVVSVVQTAGLASGSTFPLGVTTNTFRATDAAGNFLDETFTVTVSDAEDPVISSTPADIVQGTDAGLVTATITWTPPTAADNVGVTSFTSTHNPGDTFPIGVTTVTYTAMDAAGNTAMTSFTIAVILAAGDADPPTLVSTPGNLTSGTDAGVSTAVISFADPAFTDNVAVISVVQTAGLASGSTFPLGLTTNTFRASDAAGNILDETFTVTVSDLEDPVVTVPADIVVNMDAGLDTATVTYPAPTATDNVSVVTGPTLTAGLASGSAFPIGVTTVTYEATDAAGNTGTASFTVTVDDVELPVISGTPADIAQDTDAGQIFATVTWTAPTASDNVAVTSFTSTHAPGDAFQVGVTTVINTALDAAGNTAMSSFTVTVADTEEPVLAALPDIDVDADPGLNTAVVTYTPTATDNSGILPTIISSPISGTAFPIGVTLVTVTATDGDGNVATETFNVTVADVEAPVVTVPADIAVTTDGGLNTAVVTFAPTATDNSGIAPTITSSPASGTAFPIGTTLVTVTATDGDGNVTIETFNVTVTDAEAPVLSLPADITVGTDAGLATAVVTFAPTATDNSGTAPTITSSPASGDVFLIGTTVVTVAATDGDGNVTIGTFNVTVTDDESPVLSLPADITVTTDAGLDTAVVSFAPTATDNSGTAPTMVSSPASGDAFPVGTTMVTVTATDGDGNVTIGTFSVTVTDGEGPVVTVPADITVSTDPGEAMAIVTFAPTATDNSGIDPTIVISPVSGSTFPVGTTLVTVTATDGDGNVTVETFNVTVTDDEVPLISDVPADILVGAAAGSSTAIVTWTPPTAMDNVALASFTSSHNPGDTFPVGTTVVTYTAVDNAGNTVTASFSVTVDLAPPGTVEFVINSADDGAFVFASGAPAFNFTLNVTGGTTTSGPLAVVAGTYGFSVSIPTGFGVSGASCSGSGGVIDPISLIGAVTVAPGEVLSCTISVTDSAARTGEIIQEFLQTRSQLVLSHQPDETRRIERLTGNTFRGGGASAGFAEGDIRQLPFLLTFGSEQAGFSWSMQRARAQAAQVDNQARALGASSGAHPRDRASNRGQSRITTRALNASLTNSASGAHPRNSASTPQAVNVTGDSSANTGTGSGEAGRMDVWVEGRFSVFDVTAGNGHFAVLHSGVDYLVTPDILVGLGAQVDYTEQDLAGGGDIDGYGWMIGPYLTMKLTDGLYFDSRLAAGRASNNINPTGTYTDDFTSERYLATAAIYGSFDRGNLNIRPEARLNYYEETSLPYFDSLGAFIPEQSVSIGEFEFGPKLTWTNSYEDGTVMKPFVSFEGIWTFQADIEGTSVTPNEFARGEGLRGRVGAGLEVYTTDQGSLAGEVSYDGIGDADYEAFSGKLRLTYPLN